MMIPDPLNFRRRDLGLGCEIRPGGDCLAHLQEHFGSRPYAESIGDSEEIIPGYASEFSVDGHQMLVRPFPCGIVGEGDIIGGRQTSTINDPLEEILRSQYDAFCACLSQDPVIHSLCRKERPNTFFYG